MSQSHPATIESEIEVTRARLAGTIDELAVRLRPQEIARRGVLDAQARLRAAILTPQGAPRVERLAAVGAAVLAVVGLVVVARRRG